MIEIKIRKMVIANNILPIDENILLAINKLLNILTIDSLKTKRIKFIIKRNICISHEILKDILTLSLYSIYKYASN